MPYNLAASGSRPGVNSYAADLKAKLCIAADQVGAWSVFADALSGNHRRMAGRNANGDEPFGALADRLAALAHVSQAGRVLMDALSPEQQHIAAQVLPLCCLQQR
jgi:hypothetical protein